MGRAQTKKMPMTKVLDQYIQSEGEGGCREIGRDQECFQGTSIDLPLRLSVFLSEMEMIK